MSNQPDHPRQVRMFYSDGQITGRRPTHQAANKKPAPASGPLTRKGYSSKYPNRMRNGKPGA